METNTIITTIKKIETAVYVLCLVAAGVTVLRIIVGKYQND